MDMSLFTSFEGRINRQKWWLGLIALMILQWIVLLIIGMISGGGMMTGMDPNNPEAAAQAMGMMSVPLIIVILIFLWPSLAIYTKRWHDRGKSGWWTLIILIPLIGAIWALVEMGFLRGTDGPNEYGNDPLAS
ncbi:MAG: DUF805 domain-containing protein [Rhizobiales bacterium]|nr:DUF805 domain-containing protein [Hyphomicrobiales bacterium]